MRHLEMPLLAAIATALSTAPTYADLGDQLAKLLPDDGAAEDYFGVSVATGGSAGNEVAIVGVINDDDNGSNSGSVYVFDVTTGNQIMKLLPRNGSAYDWFGSSVAISGTTAIVGALGGHNEKGINTGSAYLFDITTGRQLFKLLANDGAAYDDFGCSVAISGDIAIVGAREDYHNGADSGSAYLFDTTTGQQIAKLLADDGETDDGFGRSVAISGTIAIVGAYLDDDNGYASGSAYLFNTATGRQIAKLLPDDGEDDDLFGTAVAIGGPPGEEIALITAAGYNDNFASHSGSAYVFDATTGTQLANFVPDDSVVLGYFGWSVAISGPLGKEMAVVGAVADNDNGFESGSAYLLDISDPANPTQIAKLLANDGEQKDYLGVSVAISGTTAIVGAYGDDDNGTDSGSAYLFDATAPRNCPWDVNGDGVVNHRDLVEVVHNLGRCDDPDNCPWDVNGDGVVNGADVSEVATHFGPCP